VPGRSELRHLCVPVGVVESAFPRPGGEVEATARLRPGYEFLRAPGSRFVLIKPQISLREFSGIEPRYRKLVRRTSKFRDASGTAARIGPFKIDLPNHPSSIPPTASSSPTRIPTPTARCTPAMSSRLNQSAERTFDFGFRESAQARWIQPPPTTLSPS